MKPAKNSLLGSLLDTEPQGGVVFRALVEQLAGPPPRDAELEAERTKLVDAELGRLNQQDEAFKKAIVARMEKDNDFRLWVLKEAKTRGKGRRGGKPQNLALVRSIVAIPGFGDDAKKGTTKALAKTVGVSPRQARRLKGKVRGLGPDGTRK